MKVSIHLNIQFTLYYPLLPSSLFSFHLFSSLLFSSRFINSYYQNRNCLRSQVRHRRSSQVFCLKTKSSLRSSSHIRYARMRARTHVTHAHHARTHARNHARITHTHITHAEHITYILCRVRCGYLKSSHAPHKNYSLYLLYLMFYFILFYFILFHLLPPFIMILCYCYLFIVCLIVLRYLKFWRQHKSISRN